MTNEQKEQIQFGLDWATSHIQEIETGSDDLHKQVDRIEHQLVMLFEDVVEALPKAMRVQAQVCMERYPFIEWTERGPVPVAQTVLETLNWLATVQRVEVPTLATPVPRTPRPQDTSFSKPLNTTPRAFPATIRDWCAKQDPHRAIGAYVDLNSQGIGHCPFGWHHAHGRDTHASFKVYDPGTPGGYCWYCYVWQQGGSVFDFLRYWYNLDARELWQRLQAREVYT